MMLVIYGPTATGKTGLAITLAKKYNGEILSADSRQVYKGLDITTGKVSFDSKVEKHSGYWIVDGVRINGFDIKDPSQQFTAADFLKFAHTSLIRIRVAEKLPIVVGGTGFYIKALIEPIDSIGIPANPKLRGNLQKLSVQELFQKLSSINSQKAKSMNRSDRKNPRRLIRAIEIALSFKKKITT
ncbi:tRNA (adenosine(37)-N6)-dimethylallyltransferase MiaA, partial [Candidatus Curtissbacteria bacterium]|nr:tRNA (adenosine(37)-N6)-dimethylallyltransferase MiaA [Candidatus Curtissbacteria bacterium]